MARALGFWGMAHEHEPHQHQQEPTGNLPVKAVLELLTLWGNHMASIDTQLAALQTGLTNLEAAVKGLSPASPDDLTPVTQAIAAVQTTLNTVGTNVTSVGNKLGSDTFAAVGQSPS